MNPSGTLQELEEEIQALRAQLEEANATIRAIRTHQVDAFLVEQGSEEQVLVLDGVDRPYRLFIERMQQGAVTVLFDATIAYANHRFAEMLDAPLASLTASNLSDHLVSSERATLLRLLQVDAPIETEHEFSLRRSDGTTLPVHVTVSPLLEEKGIFCVIVTDVTQQKRHEAERESYVQAQAARAAAESTAALLLEADRRKDEFLAMLAHELRNPLAPLRSGLEILNRIASKEEEIQKTRDMMTRQIESLVRLVDDLLDISRVTHGKITLQRERTDLATIVSRALESMRAHIEEREHRLEVYLPEERLPVEADVVRMTQVITNLLSNATKFMPHGGAISLLVEKRDSHAEIRVRDNGIGIAPEMLPKVFDLFAQASSSAGRSEGGLGIGLTLASRLVGMHGGTLHAFSKGIGQGSEFVVHLPLLSDAGDGSDVPAGSEEPCPTARRILVVDDHRDAAESLAILLRLRGHEVREEYEGSEALNAALDFHPDVVFLDIGLPGMSGYEVATRIREDARLKGIRLVALSGYGSEDHRRQCKAVGFDALLVKPVELASIEHALAAQASSDDAWR